MRKIIVSNYLTQAGLIDEYQLFINPVALGNGKPLFSGMTDTVRLKLLETRTFQCGVVLLRYQPAARDPGRGFRDRGPARRASGHDVAGRKAA
jgi:hypothetical protein